MNEEALKNVAVALRDAEKIAFFRETFCMSLWGYPNIDRVVEEESNQDFNIESHVGLNYEVEYQIDETMNEVEGYVSGDHYDNIENMLRCHRGDLFELVPHNCGAPACALGHYALRSDLQDFLDLDYRGSLITRDPSAGRHVGPYDHQLQEHFGIDKQELEDLFGAQGCGGAETPAEAADYIEQFIQRKREEKSACTTTRD